MVPASAILGFTAFFLKWGDGYYLRAIQNVLVIHRIQMNTAVRWHLTLVRMAIVKLPKKEKKMLVGVKLVQPLWEIV